MTLNDKLFRKLGAYTGSLNDRMYEDLVFKGYTGALPDMIKQAGGWNTYRDELLEKARILIDFGNVESTSDKWYNHHSTSLVKDVNGTKLVGSVTLDNSAGIGSTGRGSTDFTSDTLTNHYYLRDFDYINTTSGAMTLQVSGLVDTDKSYDVSITASRDTTAVDRVGEYTVGGVTKDLDASDDPPSVITFSSVAGSDLLASGIECDLKAGSIFAYFGGVEIKEL